MSATDEHVYVYGITRAGASPPRRAGVLGAPVTTIDCGALAAIASLMPDGNVRAKRRDLLRHSDVLQQAFAAGVVLPLRFGTLFPGRQALAGELLTPHQDRLLSLLDRFDGAGEMRLRVSYDDQSSILAEIVRGNPAIARLRAGTRDSTARGSLVQLGEAVADAFAARRRADAETIVTRLAATAVDVVVDEQESELEVVRASFLVERKGLDTFEKALESVALVHRHLMNFSCTGPLPPHSFVDLGG
jgi:hypothetical protein